MMYEVELLGNEDCQWLEIYEDGNAVPFIYHISDKDLKQLAFNSRLCLEARGIE